MMRMAIPFIGFMPLYLRPILFLQYLMKYLPEVWTIGIIYLHFIDSYLSADTRIIYLLSLLSFRDCRYYNILVSAFWP